MRGTWLIVAAAAAVLLAACATQKTMTAAPQDGVWPSVEYPVGSGITAALRLQEIIDWAEADGTPLANEAKLRAETCARDHRRTGEVHSQEVLRARNHAHKVATQPGLPPHEKDQLWQACVDELTHGP